MDFRDEITRLKDKVYEEYVFSKEFFTAIALKEKSYYAMIDNAENSNNWISFDDKMPDSNTPVLMKCRYMWEYITIGTLIYDNKTKSWYRGKSITSGDVFMRSGILTWKPLDYTIDRWDCEIWNRIENVTSIL